MNFITYLRYGLHWEPTGLIFHLFFKFHLCPIYVLTPLELSIATFAIADLQLVLAQNANTCKNAGRD